MKFTALAAAASLALTATGAAAQMSPISLIEALEGLLSAPCQSAINTLISPNSSFSQCLQIQNLYPILLDNSTSVIGPIEDYLVSLCAAPACTPAVINNASVSIMTSCSSDFESIGLSNSTLEIIFGAYPTAREVACLTTAGIAPVSTLTNYTMSYNSTSNSNSTNSSLCAIDLLEEVQTYLGSPLTNSYVDTLLLGGNATAYDLVLGVISNASVLAEFACNDCVAGALDIVLENYPVLDNLTFVLPLEDLYTITGNSTYNTTGSVNFTVPTLYESFCMIDVGSNVTLPPSLNETAYNTTLPYNSTLPTNTSSPNITIPVVNPNVTYPSPLSRAIKFAREI